MINKTKAAVVSPTDFFPTEFSVFVTVAIFVSLFVFQSAFNSVAVGQTKLTGLDPNADWPCWRGPNGNGIADPNQNPPTVWSNTKNILWKAPVAGKGHGSPTILGDQVFITAADLTRDIQTIICVDRSTGKQVWEATVHRSGLKTKGNRKQNKKASLASTTVATDGKMLFVNFLNNEAVWTSALSLKGKVIWQKEISKYVVHQGYGSSPVLYDDLVIVSADNKGGGKIMALRKTDGEMVWERSRPKKPNYPSPAILKVAGKTQLVMTGCDLVTSLDPKNGEENWEVKGATTECVSTTVTDGTHVYTSGGYPKNHISAVAADGSGKIVWEKNFRVYVPSMICHSGHLFAVLDAGTAICLDSRTGEEKWKGRLAGNISSSPIQVGNLIYSIDEKGVTTIFKANPEKFELVAKNKLSAQVLSTPAICGSRIYLRVAVDEAGRRQEYLYCIGQSKD